MLVNSATIRETAIKSALGRLDLHGADVVAEIAANRFVELPITATHAAAAAALPRHHDDPFDRMLIAQTQIEHLRCVTRDPTFSAYRTPTLW